MFSWPFGTIIGQLCKEVFVEVRFVEERYPYLAVISAGSLQHAASAGQEYLPFAGPSKQPVQTAVRGLSTKRILVGLFLLGPFLVQLLDNAGLLHHPESHITHAMVNLFSAIWAIAVVGIALNGGLAQLHSEAPRGQQGCLVHLIIPWAQVTNFYSLRASQMFPTQLRLTHAYHPLLRPYITSCRLYSLSQEACGCLSHQINQIYREVHAKSAFDFEMRWQVQASPLPPQPQLSQHSAMQLRLQTCT